MNRKLWRSSKHSCHQVVKLMFVYSTCRLYCIKKSEFTAQVIFSLLTVLLAVVLSLSFNLNVWLFDQLIYNRNIIWYEWRTGYVSRNILNTTSAHYLFHDFALLPVHNWLKDELDSYLMMMMMSRSVMFARSYSEKQLRACWWNDLMKSSVFRSWQNEDGRWQLCIGAGSEFHVDSPATAKLRGPHQTVLVTGTERSPCLIRSTLSSSVDCDVALSCQVWWY